jgi:hypothetical protein
MLVLFGDSFASEWHEGDHTPWFKMLAEELGTTYKTYGVHGSSFEYSTLKFFEYLNSDEYSPDDHIVFVCTSTIRSPVIAEDFVPRWAALAYGKVFRDEQSEKYRNQLDKIKEPDEHFNRFKNFYKDWFLLQNDDLILAQRFMLLSTLHSLPNKTVSISGWDTETPIAKSFDKHINCLLWEASNNEIADGSIWDFMGKHGRDFRMNHFEEQNHHVLKDATYSYLTGNPVEITVDSFQKNIFTLN